MKIKHLLIVSLMLAILTIGVVSAAENDDALASEDMSGESLDLADEEVILEEDASNPPVSDPTPGEELDLKVSDVPEEVKFWERVYLNVTITDDCTSGEFAYYLNDDSDSAKEVWFNCDNGEGGNGGVYTEKISFKPVQFGPNVLHVKFLGNDKYPEKIYDYNFNVEDWYLNINEFYMSTPALGNDYDVYLDFPYDAWGKFVVSVDGKEVEYINKNPDEDEEWDYYYCTPNFEGDMYVTLPASYLKHGLNELTIHYIPFEGSKFSEKTVNAYINVTWAIVYPSEESMIYGGKANISLILPNDAKGNLSVLCNGKSFKNVSVENGFAFVPLNDLNCGKYDIEASYTGDDYNVSDVSFVLSILPKVDVPPYVYSKGDNYTIVITLPEDKTSNLIVELEGGMLYSNESASGIVEISVAPTLGGTISVTCNEAQANYYVEPYENSPEFNFGAHIDDFMKGVDLPIQLVYDWEKYEGDESLMGVFNLYVDGKLFECLDPNGYIEIDAGSLSVGNHTWILEYTGDPYYYASENRSGSFEIIYIDFSIPQDIPIDDGTILVRFAEDATGIVTVLVDGKEYKSALVTGETTHVYIGDLPIGTHDVEVKYEGNYPEASRKVQIDVDYDMRIYCQNEREFDEYLYGEKVTLVIVLPDEATGVVNVNVGDANYTVQITNGSTTLELTDLAVGTYHVSASYSGDSKFPAKSDSVSFEVTGFGIIYSGDPCYGEDKDVTLSLPKGAEGNLTVEIDNELYETVKLNEQGKASISLKYLAPGNHKINAKYTGEDYQLEELEMWEEVYIYLEYPDVYVGETAYVYMVVPADIQGNITIDMGEFGKQNLTPDSNGVINFTLPYVKFGEYDFTLSYDADDYNIKFEDDYGEGPVPYVYTVKVELDTEKGENNDGKLTLNLPSDAKGKVSIYTGYGDEERLVAQQNVTGPNPTISLDMLGPGEHDIKLVYEDEKYGTFVDEDAGIYISKPTPTINVASSGDDKKAVITFELPKGSDGSLMIKVDGIKSYFATVLNGVTNLTIENLAAGEHKLEITYSGDSNYSDVVVNETIKIASSIPAKITANDASVMYTGGKYSVTVYAEGGELAKNVEVVFKINGKKVGTAKTNDKGIATYNVKQVPGTYKITVEALGVSATKKLTVKHVVKLQKVKVKKSAKKLVIKVTLAKVNGKYIKGKKVTLKFNGKKFTAKTNKKGVAKFTIKKKFLKKLKKGKKVKYQATYLKDTVKYSVKVK